MDNNTKLIPKGLAGLISKLLKAFLSSAKSAGKTVKTVSKSTKIASSSKPTKEVTKTVVKHLDPEVDFAGVENVDPSLLLKETQILVENPNWNSQIKSYNLGLHLKNMQRILKNLGKTTMPATGWHNLTKPTGGTWVFDPNTGTYANEGKTIFFDGTNWLIAQ